MADEKLKGRQRQVLHYQAFDEETGRSIINFTLDRGFMSEDQMKKDEGKLLATIIDLISSARN